MRIALLIQYDGSNYYGWQIQKDPQTVQGHLERALSKMFDRTIGVVGSGRTDSGVHALGQVAHFDIQNANIPSTNIWMALNRDLPDDIRAIASQAVGDDFHSRFGAIERKYRYQISTAQNVLNRNAAWYVRFPINVEQLHSVSQLILGQHDFSSFCYAGTETENMTCTIESANWTVGAEGQLVFEVKGNRFLHHMVRMLVGSMIEVARGKWTVGNFTRLLEHPDRQAHVITAPARGLALMQVTYPEDIQPQWQPVEEKLASESERG